MEKWEKIKSVTDLWDAYFVNLVQDTAPIVFFKTNEVALNNTYFINGSDTISLKQKRNRKMKGICYMWGASNIAYVQATTHPRVTNSSLRFKL